MTAIAVEQAVRLDWQRAWVGTSLAGRRTVYVRPDDPRLVVRPAEVASRWFVNGVLAHAEEGAGYAGLRVHVPRKLRMADSALLLFLLSLLRRPAGFGWRSRFSVGPPVPVSGWQ